MAGEGCAYHYGPPIQKTLALYGNRAVFTAHIIQLMGEIDTWQGKRRSDRALAVVRKSFWGLAWYWPKIVLLRTGLNHWQEGEDYLVVGEPAGYGMIDSGCNRTQPLSMAQVDLRTLDGSPCRAPGGALIGALHQPDTEQDSHVRYPGKTVTLTDPAGRQYTRTTDAEGAFEFSHLPPGRYRLAPIAFGTYYVHDSVFDVKEGVCEDASRAVVQYAIRGRIIGPKPSDSYPEVLLIPATGVKTIVWTAYDRGVGFHFFDIPPGEYLLGVNLVEGAKGDAPLRTLYYPGTFDPAKAERIRVGEAPNPRWFDMPVKRLATDHIRLTSTPAWSPCVLCSPTPARLAGRTGREPSLSKRWSPKRSRARQQAGASDFSTGLAGTGASDAVSIYR